MSILCILLILNVTSCAVSTAPTNNCEWRTCPRSLRGG